MCRFYPECPRENCPFAHGEEELARLQEEEAATRGSNRGKGQQYWDAPQQSSQRRGERSRASRVQRTRRGSERDDYQHLAEPAAPRGAEEFSREPPLPRNSISRRTLQQISALLPCKHAAKGCNVALTPEDLSSHLEACPFEKCKEQLLNGKSDPIIKFFKKQIAERDKLIQELRAQCSESFKEEEDRYALDDDQVTWFKELVFKTTTAAKIAALFGEKYPTAEWSVFIHHVSESDLSYVYDGYLQWVYKGRRHILVKLNKPEEENLLL